MGGTTLMSASVLCLVVSGACHVQVTQVMRPNILRGALLSRIPPPLSMERTSEAPPKLDDGGKPNLPGAPWLADIIDSPKVELFNAACVASALMCFALSTLELPSADMLLLRKGELAIVFGFAIEYLLRWYSQNLNPSARSQARDLARLTEFLPHAIPTVPAHCCRGGAGQVGYVQRP